MEYIRKFETLYAPYRSGVQEAPRKPEDFGDMPEEVAQNASKIDALRLEQPYYGSLMMGQRAAELTEQMLKDIMSEGAPLFLNLAALLGAVGGYQIAREMIHTLDRMPEDIEPKDVGLELIQSKSGDTYLFGSPVIGELKLLCMAADMEENIFREFAGELEKNLHAAAQKPNSEDYWLTRSRRALGGTPKDYAVQFSRHYELAFKIYTRYAYEKSAAFGAALHAWRKVNELDKEDNLLLYGAFIEYAFRTAHYVFPEFVQA